MRQNTLKYTFLPELGRPKRGKVRDIYEGEGHFTFIASDRLSVFDRILEEAIPEKGQILTEISNFWFRETEDIVKNHLIESVDPNVTLVKKCTPLKIEVVVRNYLTGSIWRDYRRGKREKCGIPLPEGLKEHDKLPGPILTPTTKMESGHDEDISKEELIERNIAAKELYEEIEKCALALFKRGSEHLERKGLILADTKFEFGLDGSGSLTLIDELFTPDSSRFFPAEEFSRGEVKFLDKEFAREYCRSRGFVGEGAAPPLPEEVVERVRSGYRSLYRTITGRELDGGSLLNVKERLFKNLKASGHIRGYFALLIAESGEESSHVDKIAECLSRGAIPHERCAFSLQRERDKLLSTLEEYNRSLEPVVCIVAPGRSNDLSAFVAKNLRFPVIASPVSEELVNIDSSLQMESSLPALTVADPSVAAFVAEEILNRMEIG